MFGYVDEQGNELPFGGPQRIVVIGDPRGHGYQQQEHPPQQQLPPEIQKDFALARLRQMHANARHGEVKILLDGLSEMRQAISNFKIAEGDRGGNERPAIETGFDQINLGKLQAVYLSLSEKYLNYCDHMLTKQLQIPTTNYVKPISDKKDESVQK